MEQASGRRLSIKEKKRCAHTRRQRHKPIITVENKALIVTKYFRNGDNFSDNTVPVVSTKNDLGEY